MLRQSGMEAAILKHANSGTVVFGVCGGYQMLGKQISDPYGEEDGTGKANVTPGMGLLDIETTFIEKKRTIRWPANSVEVQGIFSALSGCSLWL